MPRLTRAVPTFWLMPMLLVKNLGE
jgi:hypothetical protein